MLWNQDRRYRLGGFWKCREKKRLRNARRVRMFGPQVTVPDMAFREFAVQLREERKETVRGRA